MRRAGLRFLVLLFVINGATAGFAQELLPSIKRIVDRGEIIVGTLDKDLPPVIVTDKDGNLSGFDISLARVIGRELGTKVRFLRVSSFDDVIRLVATKQADIGISLLSRTAERARVVLFSRPYIEQTRTLLINRVRGLRFRRSCPTVEEMIELVKTENLIGVVAGTAHASRFRLAVPETKQVPFESFQKMMEALNAGKLMASTQDEVTARQYLHDDPSANIRLKLCEYRNRANLIGIAVRPDAPDLVRWLDVLLDENKFRFDGDNIIGQDPERLLP